MEKAKTENKRHDRKQAKRNQNEFSISVAFPYFSLNSFDMLQLIKRKMCEKCKANILHVCLTISWEFIISVNEKCRIKASVITRRNEKKEKYA